MGHKKRILAVLAAPAAIALSTLAAASQADRATAIGRLDMAGLHDLDRNNVRSIQRVLVGERRRAGPCRRNCGPTLAAVRKFQDRYGMKATGQIDNQTLFALGKPDLAAH